MNKFSERIFDESATINEIQFMVFIDSLPVFDAFISSFCLFLPKNLHIFLHFLLKL